MNSSIEKLENHQRELERYRAQTRSIDEGLLALERIDKFVGSLEEYNHSSGIEHVSLPIGSFSNLVRRIFGLREKCGKRVLINIYTNLDFIQFKDLANQGVVAFVEYSQRQVIVKPGHEGLYDYIPHYLPTPASWLEIRGMPVMPKIALNKTSRGGK